MPKLTLIDHDGGSTELDVDSGVSVMQAAVDNGVDAIVAECGGACSCATCHVYIDDAWTDKVPGPQDIENDMIECVLDPKPNSRLSCQVIMDDSLDGLVVRLPESQY